MIGSILLFAAILFLDSRGFFNLRKIELTHSNQQVSPAIERWQKELEQDLQSFYGASLLELPFEKISDHISPLQWVKDYRLVRRFPSELKVELVPHRWLALFASDKGKFKGLSDDCKILPAVEFLETTDVVLVSSDFLGDEKARQELCDLLLSLEPESSHLYNGNIHWVELRGGELVLHLDEPAVELRMGKNQVLSNRKRIERVLQDLEKKSLTPSVISALSDQKIIVKLHKPR